MTITIIYHKNYYGVLEVRLEGSAQSITLQPRFFARITGVSPYAVAGIITDAPVKMANDLGFIGNSGSQEEAVAV